MKIDKQTFDNLAEIYEETTFADFAKAFEEATEIELPYERTEDEQIFLWDLDRKPVGYLYELTFQDIAKVFDIQEGEE